MKTHVSLKGMAEDKDTDFGVGKATSFTVDPSMLTIEEGFNGRPLDHAHVRAMADSYKAGATFPDIEVRVNDAGEIVIVDGHHRHAGALLAIKEGAEILKIGAKHFRGSDADRVMLMVTSQQGLPMTPLQLGVQYKKMLGFGWTPAAVAGRAGKSAQHVKDCIALAETNSDVQAMVTRGEVSAAVALKTAKKLGGGAGKALADDLAKAKATGKKKVTAKTASVKTVTMSLIDAIRAEIDSNGVKKAHELAPKYKREIQYLRATGLS